MKNKIVNKFGARKTIIDGRVFDSKKEADRWLSLRYLERAGKISCLLRQVKFLLLPKTKTERKIEYVADFTYIGISGESIIEDVKSPATKQHQGYILKRKLVKAIYIDKIKIEGVEPKEYYDKFVEY